MASIPMSGDLVDLIGPFAERVENRSLLLDKFCFHKQWGLGDLKANEAHRWTLLRISDNGPRLLAEEAQEKQRGAQRLAARNPAKSERLRAEAGIESGLAATRVDSPELSTLRANHTRRFVSLFRNAYGSRAVVMIGQLEGRLAINLADSLIESGGISLDRLFGLPFIAGSAVKGASRHAALEELKASNEREQVRLFEEFREVFGTADNDFSNGDLHPFRDLLGDRAKNWRGRVAFLAAYPVNEAKVVVDLTNVHYPDYYRTGKTEELSQERPKPNPFPAVELGAQFAFCLVLTSPQGSAASLNAAHRWLESALTVRGLGAKTASGYGWFSLQPTVLERIEAEEKEAEAVARSKAQQEAASKAAAAEEAARIAAMPPSEVARDRFIRLNEEGFAKAVSDSAAFSTEEQKGLLLALLSPERKDTWKRWKKSDKPANKARVEALLAAAKTHGIVLP